MGLKGKDHFSQSKLKEDIENLNTNDFLIVNLKIKTEKSMKPNFNKKCDVFSNTIYLWIGILKTCILQRKMALFSRKTKSEGETILL